MKKILALLLALVMVLGLAACGGETAKETEAPAETAAPAEGGEEVSAEKAPEDYTGNLVVYSPHDADPLNAGVALFQ